MVVRTLITTSDERTWPKDRREPVLFLGEWCTLYDRKKYWCDLNYEVVPYHWHDKNKFNSDYCYLNDIYEETLKQLVAQLNKEHGVDHSLRYWRILVGPWLGYFIQVLFDRWSMLMVAIQQHENMDCMVIEQNLMSSVPYDMADFVRSFVTDSWNEVIYAQLLDYLKPNNVNVIMVSGLHKLDYREINLLQDIRKSIGRRMAETAVKSLNRLFLRKKE